MKFISVTLPIICIMFFKLDNCYSQDKEKDKMFNQILERYRIILLSGASSKDEIIDRYMATIKDDGTWDDIDYKDLSQSTFFVGRHLSRVEMLSKAYLLEHSKFFKSPKLFDVILKSLEHWAKHKYIGKNWWNNEIGTPMMMRNILTLLKDELKGNALFQQALKVVGQFNVRGTGANLTWSAELAVHYAAFTKNPKLLKDSVQKIWNEISEKNAEGIQSDGSYFQHGPRLQTFHYGQAFIYSVIKNAWQLNGTDAEIPKDKKKIISSYLLRGPQWMCREEFITPSTLDRSCTRVNSLTIGGLHKALELWLDVDLENKDKIQVFISNLQGKGVPLEGHRYFPLSDFAVFHHKKASFFIKTVSIRNSLTESINSENLKGYPYLSCGDHYIIRNGKEYTNLQPVWKWDKLPGLTSVGLSSTQIREDFTGGLSNGSSGMNNLIYKRGAGKKKLVSVNKTWFCHEDLVVCLLSNWDIDDSITELKTSIEQSRFQGKATIDESGGLIELEKVGHFKNINWVTHNEIGYIPLEGIKFDLNIDERKGSWFDINNRFDAKVSETVFQLEMNHSKTPKSAGYVIVLDGKKERLKSLFQKQEWSIIQNDSEIQCVKFQNGLYMATIYKPMKNILNGQFKINKPCLVMWDENELWISDPTHKKIEVEVEWNQKIFTCILPSEGKSLKIEK